MKWMIALALVASSFAGYAKDGEILVESIAEGLQKDQALLSNRAYDQMYKDCTARYNGDIRENGKNSWTVILGENRMRYVWAGYCVPKRASVYAVARSRNPVEVHALSKDASYQSFKFQTQTALGQVGTSLRSQFQLADYDKDGIDDLFLFSRQGTGTGTTELHVMRGPEYKTFLNQTGTALSQTGDDNGWKFLVGDYNRDGALDVYVIKKSGAEGTVEVHVLDGAKNYKSYLTNQTTAASATGTSSEFDYALGDYNGDGVLDVYCIHKNGGSGKTEVHVLDGASNFKKYIGHHATGLGMTGSGQDWVFSVGDYNLDGIPDLYAFRKSAIYAEVHVWNGASAFSNALLQIASPFPTDGKTDQYDLLLGRAKN